MTGHKTHWRKTACWTYHENMNNFFLQITNKLSILTKQKVNLNEKIEQAIEPKVKCSNLFFANQVLSFSYLRYSSIQPMPYGGWY